MNVPVGFAILQTVCLRKVNVHVSRFTERIVSVKRCMRMASERLAIREALLQPAGSSFVLVSSSLTNFCEPRVNSRSFLLDIPRKQSEDHAVSSNKFWSLSNKKSLLLSQTQRRKSN